MNSDKSKPEVDIIHSEDREIYYPFGFLRVDSIWIAIL
jgi:hypothetical protein